jgi:coenzyme F420-reducing hydrogenase beta subunit
MATGLPCQMAALRQYLHNDYDNLIVVDLICHSVTSPLAFAMYKESLERKFKSKLVDYHPKNKEYGGWHHFAVKATFENGKIYHKCGADDTFTWLFVGSNNLLSRPSCYECRFKVFPKPSDITIGDYWGVEFIDPDFDSPKGVSKITINSKKGLDYYLKVDTFCDKEYSKEIAIFSNRRSATQIRSVLPPDSSLRQQFVADLNKIGYDSCMKKYNPNEENVIIKRIKWILSRITK